MHNITIPTKTKYRSTLQCLLTIIFYMILVRIRINFSCRRIIIPAFNNAFSIIYLTVSKIMFSNALDSVLPGSTVY